MSFLRWLLPRGAVSCTPLMLTCAHQGRCRGGLQPPADPRCRRAELTAAWRAFCLLTLKSKACTRNLPAFFAAMCGIGAGARVGGAAPLSLPRLHAAQQRVGSSMAPRSLLTGLLCAAPQQAASGAHRPVAAASGGSETRSPAEECSTAESPTPLFLPIFPAVADAFAFGMQLYLLHMETKVQDLMREHKVSWAPTCAWRWGTQLHRMAQGQLGMLTAPPCLLQLTRYGVFAQQRSVWRSNMFDFAERIALLALAAFAFVIVQGCLSAAGVELPFPDWAEKFGIFALQTIVLRPLFASLWDAGLARRVCLAAAGPRLCYLAIIARHSTALPAASPSSPPA